MSKAAMKTKWSEIERKLLCAIVNTHGNESECIDVIPSVFVGGRPWFIMLEGNRQIAREGYWFADLPYNQAGLTQWTVKNDGSWEVAK